MEKEKIIGRRNFHLGYVAPERELPIFGPDTQQEKIIIMSKKPTYEEFEQRVKESAPPVELVV